MEKIMGKKKTQTVKKIVELKRRKKAKVKFERDNMDRRL
jgi:hypothetical protein